MTWWAQARELDQTSLGGDEQSTSTSRFIHQNGQGKPASSDQPD